METLIHDVRYGLRQIARSRLHAVVVVLTLGLGIGLNTGVFSVLSGLMFRPRVTKDPATFVHMATEVVESNQTRLPPWPFSAPDYDVYRASARSVSALAAWAPAHANIDNTWRRRRGGRNRCDAVSGGAQPRSAAVRGSA